MEIFNVNKVSENEIEFRTTADLAKVYKMILDNKDFILSWPEGKEVKSLVIVAEPFAPKLRTGELVLRAAEKKEDAK